MDFFQPGGESKKRKAEPPKQFGKYGTPLLSAYDAERIQRKRFKLMKSTFDDVLEEVTKKIQALCRESVSVKSLRYTVPASILGFPLYRPADARFYVGNKLRKLKYRVTWPENSKRIMMIKWGDEGPI